MAVIEQRGLIRTHIDHQVIHWRTYEGTHTQAGHSLGIWSAGPQTFKHPGAGTVV